MIAPFPPGGGVICIEAQASQLYHINGGDVVLQQVFQNMIIHVKHLYNRVPAMSQLTQFAVMMFVAALSTAENLVAASVFYSAAALQAQSPGERFLIIHYTEL